MQQSLYVDLPHRTILKRIAHQAMLDRGLLPDYSAAELAELELMTAPAGVADEPIGARSAIRDLRDRLWTSIDNDDSRDLDQLTVAEAMPGDQTRILVAVADVDAMVRDSSAVDEHARHNTTSVYTAAEIFPMLPEKLSTNLTSLNPNEDRLAVVVDMVVGSDGGVQGSAIYRALVHNRAKLAYNGVAAWLDGSGPMPEALAAVDGLDDNLRLQDSVAQALKARRHVNGALSLATIEAKAVFDGDQVIDLVVDEKNRAKEIIEDFMIAANGVTARYLASRGSPSIRRVVRTPKRWPRIVQLAQTQGFTLPSRPDSAALDAFLVQARSDDPQRFPDLSLEVIKLLGPGEYSAQMPDEAAEGHFGLAVKDYTHSTAPNRRYPDVITQRLVKSALAGQAPPYRFDELDALATHFTEQEDAANRVERQVGKSAAALLLQPRIGERFDAMVTGANDKGTWARLLSIPVEGRVIEGFGGLDVGDRIHVELIGVDVPRGFIDLSRA